MENIYFKKGEISKLLFKGNRERIIYHLNALRNKNFPLECIYLATEKMGSVDMRKVTPAYKSNGHINEAILLCD